MFSALDLDPALCQALDNMGFAKPTSIQSLVIPAAMDGKDVLASAPTGTGKTAAFLLPALQHLLDFPRRVPGGVRILILAPTRELAQQVYQQATQLATHTECVIGLITGGINYGTDKDTLEARPDILVATPGRLLEHIEQESLDCRDIEWLVLDEADRLLDMGFGPVVNQIAEEARWRKQNLLFSATLEGSGLRQFAQRLLNEPVTLEANPSRKEQGKIHQWYHLADDRAHKYALLCHILREQAQSAIVFVKTRDKLDTLCGQLVSDGFKISWLRGEMPQDKRNQAIDAFRRGKNSVLVATDVAARGIDIPNVSHVINFDMPRTADIYLHRIGRTGRAGNKGTAISLIEAHDHPMLGRVARYMGEGFKARVIDSLRPKNKAPKAPVKKKKAKAKTKSKKPKTGAKRR